MIDSRSAIPKRDDAGLEKDTTRRTAMETQSEASTCSEKRGGPSVRGYEGRDVIASSVFTPQPPIEVWAVLFCKATQNRCRY